MKKGKQYRKILSGVLALCMVVVLLPFSALAENSNSPEVPISKIISAFAEPDTIELSMGDTQTEQEIIATFPNAVSATVDGTEGSQVPVTSWVRVFPAVETAFSTAQAGEFYYEPTLAEGYTLSGEAIMPSQLVNVGEVVHAPQALVGVGAESFSFQVTVTDSDPTFSIPLSGGSGTDSTASSYGKPYNWSINWDTTNTTNSPEIWYNGVTAPASGTEGNPNAFISAGIPHTYPAAGTYTITITNNASNANGIANNDAWLAAFGFALNGQNANALTNKTKVTAILSGFTPLMTRTQEQMTSSTPQVHNEWTGAFNSCTNLTSVGSGFSSGWESVASIGNNFATVMFGGCTNLQSMGTNFNLPQSDVLTSIGDSFARSMFEYCTSLQSLGANFNMPQSDALTSIGDYFAGYMFRGCTDLQSMDANFNMPQSDVLTSIGDSFASSMFEGCTNLQSMGTNFNLPQSDALTSIGDSFASNIFFNCSKLQSMGANFNLPQSDALTSIGDYFATSMFEDCTNLQSMGTNFNLPQSDVLTSIGDSFARSMFEYCTSLQSMGTNFNLPQSDALTSIGDSFASGMFYSAGTNLVINEVFRFTQGAPTQSNHTFADTFYYAGLAAGQSRSAQSIINGNDMPNSERRTFTGQDDAFSDWAIVPANLGGDGDKPDYMVTFINDTGVTDTYMPPQQGAVGDNPTGKPANPEAIGYTFDGWYTDSALTNEYDFTQNVNGDLELYAKFEGNPYTLSFDAVGGVVTPNNMSVTYNSQLGALPTPTKEGHTFNGWTINGQAITSTTVWNYTESKTAVASWTINRYTVSFDTNGGSAVNAQTVDYNTAITNPSSPTKTDNKFVAWYTDSALTTEYNFTTPITANMTLYAKWQSTIPTIINGANQTITRGQSISFTSSDDFDGYIDTVITLSDGTKHAVHTAGNNNENASAVDGSIVITLSGTYTSTLPIGTYSISINSQGGSAMANFTVVATSTPTPSSPPPDTNTPETGEQDNTPLVSTVALISVLGMATMLLYRKKRMTARKK